MTKKLKVLGLEQIQEWIELISLLKKKDIYYTPQYLKIFNSFYSKEINDSFCGEPQLFVYGTNESFILQPLIKRKIPHTNFCDLISPYGYSGPLGNFKLNPDLAKEFISEMNIYCRKNNVVTQFIRFHPLLNNHEPFIGSITVDKRNEVFYIDLTKNTDLLFSELNKKTRNQIRKAEKNNITIEQVSPVKNLDHFVHLYLMTMKNNNASEKYFFSNDFFRNTMTSLGNNISLFVAKYKDKIISSSLFLHYDNFIHYHFSASDITYRHLSANNLLLWTVILRAKKKGYQKFHLGGGLKNYDSLYHFKSGFSKDKSNLYTANLIHNKEKYDELCKDFNKESEDFFPLYRIPR